MDTGTKVVIAVVAWLVGGIAVGIVYLVVSGSDAFEAEWNEDPTEVTEWCDNVTSQLGGDEPFQSVEELAAAAVDGELEKPAAGPRTTAPEVIERWQRENRRYLTSSYFELLEGYPKELTFEGAALELGLEQAHAGEPIDPTLGLDSAARAIDRFVAEQC